MEEKIRGNTNLGKKKKFISKVKVNVVRPFLGCSPKRPFGRVAEGAQIISTA